MRLPTPDDLGNAPAWRNYIVAQTVQAALGRIPEHALAVGVEVSGLRVGLRFQFVELSGGDHADMADIVDGLETLVGDDVEVESTFEVREHRQISPSDGICWIFLARRSLDSAPGS